MISGIFRNYLSSTLLINKPPDPSNSDELVQERRVIIPWEDGGLFAVLAGGAAVNEPGGNGLTDELGTPVIETDEVVGGDGFSGLDFDGLEGVRRGLNQGVDLVPLFVSEEMKGWLDESSRGMVAILPQRRPLSMRTCLS